MERRDIERRDPTVVVTRTGGSIPTEVEGTIDGNPFFFSERGGEWDLWIAPPGHTPHLLASGAPIPFYWVGRMRWEEPRCDGYEDALALIGRYAREFARHGWTHTPE